MASWNPPTTYATGNVLAVTAWNNLANDVTFLAQAPYALVYNSVGTVATTGTITQVSLGGTTASNYGFTVSSNNLIVPIAGIYQVYFGINTITSGGSGVDNIVALLYQNGTLVLNGTAIPSYVAPQSTGAGLVSCAAGTTLGLYLENNSNFTLSTVIGGNNTFLHAAFVGFQ